MEKSYEIIIATDYSEAANHAEQYAIQFARKTNSAIIFLHVFPPPLTVPLDTFVPEKIEYNPMEYETSRLKDHINDLFRSLNINDKEISYRYVVREGGLVREIQMEAKESGADFIFVGTHGASGFRKLFLGSNTWKIIKKSAVPVIAVPKDALSFTGLKRIVFATEYREGEIPVINYLTTFAKQFESEVIVLHVSNEFLSKEFEKILYEKFRDEVKSENSYPNLDIHFIYNEDIVEGLTNFCMRTKTDWLVMSPAKPFILEKIFSPSAGMTRKLTYTTHIPLLTVPDFYNREYADFWKMVEDGDQYWNDDL